MLEHLVGVDDVERAVRKGQGVDVTRREAQVGGYRHCGLGEDARITVETHDLAGGDAPRQVGGDRSGAAPDVEHRHAGPELR